MRNIPKLLLLLKWVWPLWLFVQLLQLAHSQQQDQHPRQVLSRFHQGQQPQNQQQWRRQADWINGAAITPGQSPQFQQQSQPAQPPQPIQRRSAAAAAFPTQIEAQQTNSRGSNQHSSMAFLHNIVPKSEGTKRINGVNAKLQWSLTAMPHTTANAKRDYFIKRARLPTISQCLPAPISGCINVYNLYVSRYRCPQRVSVYPNPPNQIVVDVQNLDIGVTGNLGGQINILIPIALFGIVQVNAHQVSVRVAVTIAAGADGGPVLQMVSCAASVGYVDVYIQNGGLVGDIANSQFRGKISEMVRQQIPGQLCQRLPGILDSEINSKIKNLIPRFVPVSKLLEVAISAFGLGNLLGGNAQCPASCNSRKAAALGTAQKVVNASVLVLPPHHQQQLKLANLGQPSSSSGQQQQQKIPLPQQVPSPGTSAERKNKISLKDQQQQSQQLPAINGPSNGGVAAEGKTISNAGVNSGDNGRRDWSIQTPNQSEPAGIGGPALIINSGTSGILQNRTIQAQMHLQQQQQRRQIQFTSAPHAVRPTRAALSKRMMVLPRPRPHRASPSDSGRLTFVDPGENFCQNCPGTGQNENPFGFLGIILQSMDLSKLNNVYLDVRLVNTYATDHDFTIELSGEFSVCGRGCTPFGAFPMQFPNCVGCKMVDILISDFTINSLLYHLHNVGFLRVRIGPETPRFGDLLKTSCGDTESEDGLEDHGVETEEGVVVAAASKKRSRRQDAGDLASLGICLGDILPSVRERYPNERVYIIISTERAPSVLLSGRNGGTAVLDFVVNADFYIQSTNTKVGTIRITATLDVRIRPQGNRISAHADVTNLNLQDVGNQLGLPQDALDNLGTLGKDIILKAGNDALERGTSLNLPNGIAGLPINIVDPEIHFQEHALLIRTDFTLDPQALGGSEPC